MKPNKPGIWHSREGYSAIVWYASGERKHWAQVSEPDGAPFLKGIRDSWRPADSLPGDDWVFVEPPKFPPLPEKPMLVYAKTSRHGPCWWMIEEGEYAVAHHHHPANYNLFINGYTASVLSLTVVPHPANDPLTVNLIEAAP